jgi:hypothetical protein
MEEVKPVEEKPVVEEKPIVSEEVSEAKASVPDFSALQTDIKQIREKFGTVETENETLKKELESLKGTSQIMDRLKSVLSGGEDKTVIEQEKAKAEFYRLLVNNPTEAIRQVYQAERRREQAAEREKNTEKEFSRFQKVFPEYKDYEEDMKAEMLANPGWFDRPDFIRRVFFDVLTQKNPKLLAKLVDEDRGGTSREPFVYESASQTLHGPGTEDGAGFIKRLQGVGGREKSYFD